MAISDSPATLRVDRVKVYLAVRLLILYDKPMETERAVL